MMQRPGGFETQMSRRDQRSILDAQRAVETLRARVRAIPELSASPTLEQIAAVVTALKRALEVGS